MQALILDADRSLASIGGSVGVTETLGFAPVPIRGGVADVRAVLAALVKNEARGEIHDFLPNVQDTRLVPNDRAQELGVAALVLDTYSALADQEFDVRLAALNRRRQGNGQDPIDSLDQSTWGPYGNALVKLAQGFAMTDLPVVATCHEKRSEDAGGFAVYEPNIRGSASSRILRSFDAVFYSRVLGSGEDARFVWQTQADETRPSAKTRGISLDFEIAQDFGPVFEAFRANNTPNPKILVLGESGTGKTTALATLASVPTPTPHA